MVHMYVACHRFGCKYVSNSHACNKVCGEFLLTWFARHEKDKSGTGSNIDMTHN